MPEVGAHGDLVPGPQQPGPVAARGRSYGPGRRRRSASAETHQGIGLHFGGRYGHGNYAVPLWMLTADPLLVVGRPPGRGRALRDQSSPGFGQGPAAMCNGLLFDARLGGDPIEPALDGGGGPHGRLVNTALADDLDEREQRRSGVPEVAVRIHRGHVLGQDLHEPQHGETCPGDGERLEGNASGDRHPVIIIDEKGMGTDSGSASRVAVVTINATNS